MYTQTPKIAFTPLWGLAFCFNLCACSTTSETFDCPAGKGVGCKSIAEVNHMVNRGALGGGVEEGTQSIVLPSPIPIMSADSLSVENPGNKFGDKILSQQAEIPLSDTMVVHRIQEEHLRVWIAPFQDTQGNLHEGSIVHTVLNPGSWQVRAVDSRDSDSRVADLRAIDPSISDANINDSGATDSHSSESGEYS